MLTAARAADTRASVRVPEAIREAVCRRMAGVIPGHRLDKLLVYGLEGASLYTLAALVDEAKLPTAREVRNALRDRWRVVWTFGSDEDASAAGLFHVCVEAACLDVDALNETEALTVNPAGFRGAYETRRGEARAALLAALDVAALWAAFA